MKLSVIVPCYNEARTVGTLLKRLLACDVGAEKEIIVVDDGSRDDTWAIVQTLASTSRLKIIRQRRNLGKGAAVRRGIKEATGDLVVVQDADLEYDPADWRQMIALFNLPAVAVVYGSRRLLPGNPVSGIAEYWGAQLINLLTNILYGVRLSDQFTCYKMIRRALLLHVPLRTSRFEVDAELTAKLLRLGHRVYEVPITYHPRTRAQGKKIRWRDGWAWLFQIIKHRFSRRSAW